jgi:hypothetical protein
VLPIAATCDEWSVISLEHALSVIEPWITAYGAFALFGAWSLCFRRLVWVLPSLGLVISIAAKHYLSHGSFLRWVETEAGLPARTAQAYMQVAHWASGKNAMRCCARRSRNGRAERE